MGSSPNDHGALKTADYARAQLEHEILTRHGGVIESRGPTQTIIRRRFQQARNFWIAALITIIVVWFDEYAWAWGPTAAVAIWGALRTFVSDAAIKSWLHAPWRESVTCFVELSPSGEFAARWNP